MATWPATIDDDGTGTTGTVLNDAFFDQVKAYIDQSVGSVWTDVPFNAANFGASGSMVWTVEAGDVFMNKYLLVGSTLFWSVYLFTTTIGGTASSQLRINLPIAGKQATSARFNMPVAYIGDGGANVTGLVETIGLTYVGISKTNLANFTVGANSCHLAFTTYFEII